APFPPPCPAPETWSPVEAPVWRPGPTIPAEPLGVGAAVVESARSTNPPAPAPVWTPAPARTPTPAPVPARRPGVPRPPARGAGRDERPPWLIPGAVAVAIVVLLGIFGVIVLANRGGTTTGQVHATATPSARASASAR